MTIENSVITSNAHILRVQAGDRIFHTGVEQARYGDKAAGTHGFRDVYTSVDLGKTNTFAGMTDFSEQTIMVTLADGSVWTSTNGSAFYETDRSSLRTARHKTRAAPHDSSPAAAILKWSE